MGIVKTKALVAVTLPITKYYYLFSTDSKLKFNELYILLCLQLGLIRVKDPFKKELLKTTHGEYQLLGRKLSRHPYFPKR